jgi:hypothetical protein
MSHLLTLFSTGRCAGWEPPPQGEAARLPPVEKTMKLYILFALSLLNNVPIPELEVDKQIIDRATLQAKG